MEPQKSVQLYLDHESSRKAHQTVQSYEYRLNHYLNWCEENDIDDIGDLTKDSVREIEEYRRKPDPAKPTLKSFIDTLRLYLRFIYQYGYVDSELAEAAQSPDLRKKENVREDIVDSDDAHAILEKLDRFKYASRSHALVILLWRTGMRTGSIRSLDLADVDLDEQHLNINHRPESDTPLKNQKDGERYVALSAETCAVLRDYIEENRIDVTDESGRKPLLTTKVGRIARNTIRKWSYRLTRPCWYSGECPHGRELSECRASVERNDNYGYECPSAVSAHAWRRGAITHFLREDMPETVVSDRANVSKDVIDRHYDKRTKKEKMEQRRDYIDSV
jgi:site-specific recombinase XerD